MRERMHTYAERHDCAFFNALGLGVDCDGVWRTNRDTAVKFFTHRTRYARELEVYHVLTAHDIFSVAGHAVPILRLFDDELLAIEMSIVRPPFLLDFAGALTDEEHQRLIMDDEAMEDRYIERLQEVFEVRAPEVLTIVGAFSRATGYMLMDVHPGNIRFE